MSFLSALTDKSWESAGESPMTEKEDANRTRKVGLRVVLTVVSVLFFLFFVAFLMRSQYPDWQPLAEEPGHPLFEQTTLWLNSVYLLLASVGVQIARMTIRQSLSAQVLWSLGLGGVFAVAFVGGQLLYWQTLTAEGFYVGLNPALSFFYLFTGLHAAHVGIGILVWLYALTSVVKKREKSAHLVELCAIYWHFLLGLWALLFALLVTKPETYDAIAAFCGLR